MKKRFCAVVLLLAVLSQSNFAQVQPSDIQLKDPAHIPARAGQVDWGLALSGGGMRSASFSIGVLKALYDNGLLDKVDVISSVSGGGFAFYWLLTSVDVTKHERFGYARFNDGLFLANICDLQSTADMVPKSVVSQLLKGRKANVEFYESRILRSFGKSPSSGQHIEFLKHAIDQAKVPYFVLGTARRGNAVKKSDDYRNFIEVTADYVGNSEVSYPSSAATINGKRLTLLDGIATSGAALRFKLKQTVDFGKDNLELSDGGHVENLGAIPLIRRGIKNIIIVDAESDDKYKFKAYTRLKKMLGEMNIDFCVPAIESYLSKRKPPFTRPPVSMGLASSSATRTTSTIYYLKLSRPASIVTGNENDPLYQAGEKLATDRNDAIECPTCGKCAKAPPLKSSTDLRTLYFYLVNHYDREREGKFGKWWRFPQFPTWDESVEPKTMEALIGLGYLAAASEWPSQP